MNLMKKTGLSLLTLCLFIGLADNGFARDWTNKSSERDKDGSFILSLAGVANDTTDDYEDEKYHYGAAALIEAGINDHFGIETGVIYTKYVTVNGNNNFNITTKVDRLHVPITARFWALDYLSFAAGPFASFKVGDVEKDIVAGGNTIGTVESSSDDSVRYGLDLAATLNFAVADKTGLFVELRHSSFFDDEDEEETNQLYGLVGVKFDI